MFKKTVLTTVIGAAFSFVTISGAYAAPISSESDPSLSGGTLIDFEAGPTGTWVTHSFGSALTVTAINSTYASQATFSVDGDFAGYYNTRGLYHITNHGGEFQSLRFDFNSPTSAFGFLFGASDSSWVLNAYNADGLLESITIPAVLASNVGDFFGFANLSGATYATLIQNQDGPYANGGVDYVFIDNFRLVGGNNNVPEPTSLALLGLSLASLAALRRRKIA